MSYALNAFDQNEFPAQLQAVARGARAALAQSGLGPEGGADATHRIATDDSFRTSQAVLTALMGDAMAKFTREGAMAAGAAVRPPYYALEDAAADPAWMAAFGMSMDDPHTWPLCIILEYL